MKSRLIKTGAILLIVYSSAWLVFNSAYIYLSIRASDAIGFNQAIMNMAGYGLMLAFGLAVLWFNKNWQTIRKNGPYDNINISIRKIAGG